MTIINFSLSEKNIIFAMFFLHFIIWEKYNLKSNTS